MAILLVLPGVAFGGDLSPGGFVQLSWSGTPTCCRVVFLDPATLAATEVSAGGLLDAAFDPYVSRLADVAVDAGGGVLVTTASSGIVRIDPGRGTQEVLTPPSAFDGDTPGGITVGSDGRIYASVQGSRPRVIRLSPGGDIEGTVTSGGLLSLPAGLAIDPGGALIVCQTTPRFASGGGGLVRVELSTGAQTLIASGPPLYGPFDLSIAPDGSIWSIQAGIFGDGRYGCLVRTDPASGFSEVIGTGGHCGAHGIAIRPDGVALVAECTRIHGACSYFWTVRLPGGPTLWDYAGPIAVVPDLPTGSPKVSWGRIKLLYR